MLKAYCPYIYTVGVWLALVYEHQNIWWTIDGDKGFGVCRCIYWDLCWYILGHTDGFFSFSQKNSTNILEAVHKWIGDFSIVINN